MCIGIFTGKNTKIYECPYCKLRFKEKNILGVHFQYNHKDKRPFPCDICQWPFRSRRDLKRHDIE